MEKTKKTAQIILCISLALMLLCGIVVNAVQTSGGKVAMRELWYTPSGARMKKSGVTSESPWSGWSMARTTKPRRASST